MTEKRKVYFWGVRCHGCKEPIPIEKAPLSWYSGQWFPRLPTKRIPDHFWATCSNEHTEDYLIRFEGSLFPELELILLPPETKVAPVHKVQEE